MRNITTRGILFTEYSCRTLSSAAGFWGCAEKRRKKTGRPGKGLQRSAASIGMLRGWDPPSFTSPSSPSPPQWLYNRGGMPSSLLVMFALNLCCGVTISGHCLFSFPLCLSTLLTGFLSPPPVEVRGDYKAIQLAKTARKWNKQFIKLFSAQKIQILAWISRAGIPPGGLCAGYSSFLLVCFSDHQ